MASSPRSFSSPLLPPQRRQSLSLKKPSSLPIIHTPMRKRTRQQQSSPTRAAVATAAVACTGNCWLMKSEPSVFSIDQLAKDLTTSWEGVRNYAARNNMQRMAIGDHVLFYHSNCTQPGVAGLGRVCAVAHPDLTALDPSSEYYFPKATATNNPWAMVDVAFVEKFSEPVLLKDMKTMKELSEMALFKQSRLSVQPATRAEYEHIVKVAQQAAKSTS